jgi:hypothetical protein
MLENLVRFAHWLLTHAPEVALAFHLFCAANADAGRRGCRARCCPPRYSQPQQMPYFAATGPHPGSGPSFRPVNWTRQTANMAQDRPCQPNWCISIPPATAPPAEPNEPRPMPR